MSTISQFLGSGGTQVGGYIFKLDAPPNYTVNGQEFQRAGVIKAYSATYANSVLAAPQLRVFGTDALSYSTGTTANRIRYSYLGTNYVAVDNVGNISYGTTVAGISTSATPPSTPLLTKHLANSGTYIVLPANTANTKPMYSSNGSTWTVVAAAFGAFLAGKLVAFGNNQWVILSTMDGTANNMAYVNSANPNGMFVTACALNLGVTAGNMVSLTFGVNKFVFYGNVGQAAVMANATTPNASGWTDITATNGLTLQLGELWCDSDFDGTAHIAVTNRGRIVTSTDGTNFTDRGVPIDASALNPLSGAAAWAGGNTDFELSANTSTGTCILHGITAGARKIAAISTDHGVTWSLFQPYLGKVRVGATTPPTYSYANGKLLFNPSGDVLGTLEIASFATPNYIGQQYQVAAGQFVRIL